MSAAAPRIDADSDRRVLTPRAQIGIYAVVLTLVFAAEAARWVAGSDTLLAGWLCGPDADWLPFLVWLLAAPLFWHFRTRRTSPPPPAPAPRSDIRRAWIGAILVAASALAASWYVGSRMDGLPPAYHDEFSYLFQARTFLAGRLWFPGFEPMPELFDQMHVLNEGRFASRYFPGVGLWMAPFLAAGNPWLGHWVANAVAGFFLFWAGREVGGLRVGLVAGLLFAVSPGVSLFSDLLLAHQPTLVGLMVFLWAFLRMKRTGSIVCAIAAGSGLAFAMLCRPMTAFGVALPFAVWFVWWLLTGRGFAGERNPVSARNRVSEVMPPLENRIGRRVKTACALGGPILIGLIAVYGYNRALTGDPWTTPYELYTDIYTPRHVYGFNNVVRGEQRLGPKVLDDYDRWAENLDARLAARNVWRRTIASLRWTMGIVPLAVAALILVVAGSGGCRDVRLIAGAIVCLHLVHVPYWFEGIMGWHYVFESAPFWLLLFAVATQRLDDSWRETGRYGLRIWWAGLVAVAVAANLFTIEPVWPGRLQVGIVEVAFSRVRYAAFEQQADQRAARQPIIVFVEADPAERHMDFVVNHPALDADVLVARYRPGETNLDEARALFPDRDAWLFQVATGEWTKLPRQSGGP